MTKIEIARQKRYVKALQKCFKQAYIYFTLLDTRAQDALLGFHNEGASVNHCVRWGLQATEDVLNDWKGFLNRMKERGAI